MNPYKGAARVTQEFVDETAWRYDLARYDEINRSLVATPIVPGWFYTGGKWIVRGEYDDVPRRYLNLERPSLGRTQEAILGSVDGSRATSFRT